MTPDDAKLSELLKRWSVPEPPPDFARRVWNQIEAEKVQTPPFARWLDPIKAWWSASWAWAPAAGLAGAAAGLILAWVSVGDGLRSGNTEFSLQGHGTLAGQYLSMISGATP